MARLILKSDFSRYEMYDDFEVEIMNILEDTMYISLRNQRKEIILAINSKEVNKLFHKLLILLFRL